MSQRQSLLCHIALQAAGGGFAVVEPEFTAAPKHGDLETVQRPGSIVVRGPCTALALGEGEVGARAASWRRMRVGVRSRP